MLEPNLLIEKFKHECQSYYACYIQMVIGMKEQKEMLERMNPSKDNKMYISSHDPRFSPSTAVINTHELIKNLETNGFYSDQMSKALLVLIYARWDEYYREHIRIFYNIKKSEVKCDIMGALRHLRHIIVHQNSKIEEYQTNLFESFGWKVEQGELKITQKMMEVFITLTHNLTYRIETK